MLSFRIATSAGFGITYPESSHDFETTISFITIVEDHCQPPRVYLRRGQSSSLHDLWSTRFQSIITQHSLCVRNQCIDFKTIHLRDQDRQLLLDFGTTHPARTATFYWIVGNVPESFAQINHQLNVQSKSNLQ